MTEAKTKTIRTAAMELISAELTEAATKSHQRNYNKLHVRRDGSVTWFESINATDDLIDGQADHFTAIKSVITVGTGICACNCDYCNAVYDAKDEVRALEDRQSYPGKDNMYQTIEDAIADAVADSDLSDMESQMIDVFSEIPQGYFDDEDS